MHKKEILYFRYNWKRYIQHKIQYYWLLSSSIYEGS